MSEHGERELLLVGVGMMGRPYVAAARRLGLRVRAIEAQDWAGAIEDLVDAVEPSRGRYGSLDELWAETVHAAALESRPDGILAFTESHVLGAAMAQDRFALPGPPSRRPSSPGTRHSSEDASAPTASASPSTS